MRLSFPSSLSRTSLGNENSKEREIALPWSWIYILYDINIYIGEILLKTKREFLLKVQKHFKRKRTNFTFRIQIGFIRLMLNRCLNHEKEKQIIFRENVFFFKCSFFPF